MLNAYLAPRGVAVGASGCVPFLVGVHSKPGGWGEWGGAYLELVWRAYGRDSAREFMLSLQTCRKIDRRNILVGQRGVTWGAI